MDWRPRDNKVRFVIFRTKWIVLPYSEPFYEETKYFEAKLNPFSGKQGYNKTNSIRKCIRISLFCMPVFLPNLPLMRPLSLNYTIALPSLCYRRKQKFFSVPRSEPGHLLKISIHYWPTKKYWRTSVLLHLTRAIIIKRISNTLSE